MVLHEKQSDYVSPKVAAVLLDVHRVTVMRWLKLGKLSSRQPFGRRGRILIPRTEVAALRVNR